MTFNNPFLWGLVAMGGVVAAIALVSSRSLGGKPYLRVGSVVLFLVGQALLVSPICEQPRFGSERVWHEVLGSIILASAAALTFPSFVTISRRSKYAEMWTSDLYDGVRNPIYLGQLLAALGFSVLYGSWIGLALVPVWYVCLLVPIIIREEQLEWTLGRAYLEYKTRVPGRFVPRWTNIRADKAPRYPYKNLVFKGGGIRGIAYVGVIEVLDENDVLQQIERVAGTSAGARDGTRSGPLRRMRLLPDESICYERLISEFGWYSSEFFYQWLKDTIAKQCDGNGMATFAEFRDRGFRELHVVASNLSERRAEVFSFETTPGVAVADAVRMSISIPLCFTALRFDGKRIGDGDLYVDGGVYGNFPIQLFDAPEYAVDNPWYQAGVNWETLGFFLYPEHNVDDLKREPANVRQYARMVLGNIYDSYQVMIYENSAVDQRRTVKITDRGVSSMQFEIAPYSDLYVQWVESGRGATRDYLGEQSLRR